MTYFRRLICRLGGHVYVIRRSRYRRKLIGWLECLACGYQPSLVAWREVHGKGSGFPAPLCRTGGRPRISGTVKLVGGN